MTGTATRKARKTAIILTFLHSPALLLRSCCIVDLLREWLPPGGQNEAISCVVGVANNWILSWEHWNGECRSLLPIR